MTEPSIVFENEQILVISKPAGLRVHLSEGDSYEDTVASWFVARIPSVLGVGENELRPGIVHRLDRDTSGVMVLAKTSHAYSALKKQFQDRTAMKVYRAFVSGIIKDERGIIDRALTWSPTLLRGKTTAKTDSPSVRPAITYWKVLERFEGEPAFTYLELYPKTGRTHQIRIHLKSIGHSIVCDEMYGPGPHKMLAFERQALHAYSLQIVVPGSRDQEVFIAQMPQDFEKSLEMLHAERGA
jgi:23S rRNA pseudouridine1911/1915/1917 synthase